MEKRFLNIYITHLRIINFRQKSTSVLLLSRIFKTLFFPKWLIEPNKNSKCQGALLVEKLWNIDCTYIDLFWSINQSGESEATRKVLEERSPGSPVFPPPKSQAFWSSKCYFSSLQEPGGKLGTMPSHNSLPNKYVYHLIWSVLNKRQQVTEQQSRKNESAACFLIARIFNPKLWVWG